MKEPVIQWDQQQLDRIHTLKGVLYADDLQIRGNTFFVKFEDKGAEVQVSKTHDPIEMLDIYVVLEIDYRYKYVEARSYMNFEKALSEFSKEVRKWHK